MTTSRYQGSETVEVLHAETNYVVARHKGRRFPGILLQGDTLSGLRGTLYRSLQSLRNREFNDADEGLDEVIEALDQYLDWYEKVLSDHGYSIPYAPRQHEPT